MGITTPVGDRSSVHFLAIDLGAASGRASLGSFDGNRLTTREIHRFSNGPVRVAGRLHWDILRLLDEIKRAIGLASSQGELVSFGIDTWGLDFGLIDASGQLLANPYHYRDMGSRDMQPLVQDRIAPRELYRRTGVQSIPFNTLYQLARLADERPALMEQARALLMTPDLLRYFLTGEQSNEYTIASTSQCLDIETGDWDRELLASVGIPTGMLAPIVKPGTRTGTLRTDVCRELGADPVAAIAVGEHDTASAMIATGGQPGAALLSLGTWGLLGTLIDRPIVSDCAFRANLANEGGVDGRYRFLRNIMGLWLLDQCRAAWRARDIDFTYEAMTRMVEATPPLQAFIDPDDARLVDPVDLPTTIGELTDIDPGDPGRILRCVVDSLAMKTRYTLDLVETCAGVAFPGLQILGGGSRNAPLCQAIANALGRPVWAGPGEATTIGNLLVQLRAAEAIETIASGAQMVASSETVRVFEPVDTTRWQAAYAVFLDKFGFSESG